MSLPGIAYVLITAVLTMGANLMMRAGIDAAGGFAPASLKEIVQGLLQLALHPLFSIGFLIYFLASVVWFRVVASEPLSTAYPILVSLTFMFVTGGAVMFFHEPVSVRKIAGLAMILFGIAMISMEQGGR